MRQSSIVALVALRLVSATGTLWRYDDAMKTKVLYKRGQVGRQKCIVSIEPHTIEFPRVINGFVVRVFLNPNDDATGLPGDPANTRPVDVGRHFCDTLADAEQVADREIQKLLDDGFSLDS